MSETEAIRRILERERLARAEAERILEAKSRELYRANQELLSLNAELEKRVEIRTGLLRDSEEMHRTLFEQHPLPLMVVRLDDGLILNVNRTAEDAYGFPRSHFRLKHWGDLGHDGPAPPLVQLDPGQRADFSLAHQRADGSRMDVELHARGLWYQSQRAAMVLILDVTERNRAQSALARSEEKYRGIIENLQLGMLEVDLDGVIRKAYPRFCDLSGYAAGELEGQDAKDLLAYPEERDMLRSRERERIDGQASVYEASLRHKDGRRIWVIISGAPIYDADGKPSGSVGIHLDITDRKRLEEELREAKDLAEESVRVKESFLANMSHEIRTPMNAIIGLGNLLDATDLDAEQREFLESIRGSAGNLLVLINDLLDLSKIQAGKLDLEERPLRIGELLEQVRRTLHYKAEDKGVLLQVRADEGIPELTGDPNRLLQVMLNLAGNAVKFTDVGHVLVEAEASLEGRFAELRLRVSDTGIGIAPNRLSSIFDEYVQADRSIVQRFGGTGLGLSISRQIVRAMGGDIAVQSRQGEGSTFSFRLRLPVSGPLGDPAASAPSRRDRPERPLADVRVLLVEDDPINQLVAGKLLERWGAEVRQAAHGAAALRLLEAETVDIILMDVQMPVLDGPSTTRRIREALRLDVPVVALTANAIRGDRERFLASGMNAYVAKPFEEAELLGTIRAMLEAHRAGTLRHAVVERDVAAAIVRPPAGEDAPATPSATAPQVPKPAAEPLNLERLEGLADGDPAFVRDMLRLFREQGALNLQGLREAVERGDRARIRYLGHRMKYQLDVLGGPESQSLVRELETCPDREGDPASVLDRLDYLVRCLMAQAEDRLADRI